MPGEVIFVRKDEVDLLAIAAEYALANRGRSAKARRPDGAKTIPVASRVYCQRRTLRKAVDARPGGAELMLAQCSR